MDAPLEIINSFEHIIKEFIVPLDVGFFIFFSLSFLLLQLIIPVGITSIGIKRRDKDTRDIFGFIFRIIKYNCNALLKKIMNIWQTSIFSLSFIFIFYVLFVTRKLIIDEVLTLVFDIFILIFITTILVLNAKMLWLTKNIKFQEHFSNIVKTLGDSIWSRQLTYHKGKLPKLPLEIKLMEEMNKVLKINSLKRKRNVLTHFFK